MLELKNQLTEAENKLNAGVKEVTGNKEKVMAKPVAEALKSFCRQEQEFAQAIVQGGSFKECMAAVAKGAGNAISDLDAYKKAVQFYFPGAEIRMQMTIDLVGAAADLDDQEDPKSLALNLEEFFR